MKSAHNIYLQEACEVFEKLNDQGRRLLADAAHKKQITSLEMLAFILQKRAAKQNYCNAEGINYKEYFRSQFLGQLRDLYHRLITVNERALAAFVNPQKIKITGENNESK